MKKALCLMVGILCGRLQAQDSPEQLEFGATTNLPGATLVFENASDYIAASSYCFPTLSGSYYDPSFGIDLGSYSYPYAGYYYNSIQVFNALPATPDNGGPVDGAAALGTQIQMKLLSATGPAGASFAFWEGASDGVTFGTNLTWSVPVPSSGDTNLVYVTQPPYTTTNDPYGYMANQVFGFTKPGLYKLTWQLVDTSTNGPGGTPLDLPSAPFDLYYQAGCTIASITSQGGGVQLVFDTPFGLLATNNTGFVAKRYIIDQSSSLGPAANWTSLTNSAGKIIYFPGAIPQSSNPGNDLLNTNVMPPAGSTQFYRLLAVPLPQTS